MHALSHTTLKTTQEKIELGAAVCCRLVAPGRTCQRCDITDVGTNIWTLDHSSSTIPREIKCRNLKIPSNLSIFFLDDIFFVLSSCPSQNKQSSSLCLGLQFSLGSIHVTKYDSKRWIADCKKILKGTFHLSSSTPLLACKCDYSKPKFFHWNVLHTKTCHFCADVSAHVLDYTRTSMRQTYVRRCCSFCIRCVRQHVSRTKYTRRRDEHISNLPLTFDTFVRDRIPRLQEIECEYPRHRI